MKTQDDLRPEGPPPARQWGRSAWTIGVAVVVVAILAFVGVRLTSDGPSASTLPKGAPALNSSSQAPEWDGLVRSLVAFDAWLHLHPDPALLDRYVTTDNAIYTSAKGQMAEFTTGALRYDPAPAAPEVASTEVLTASPVDATVRVRYATTPHYRVLDAQDEVVLDTQAGAGKTSVWHLRYVGGQWLLAGQEDGS